MTKSQTNSWQAIAACYKTHFKHDVETWQVKLWWFGRRPKEPKTNAPDVVRRAYDIKLANYIGHRKTVEREVGPMDVVIRLAFKYVYEQLHTRKMDRTMFFVKNEFSYAKLNSFIYYLVWSPFQRVQAFTKHADNSEFYAQTFWGWAVEHRNDYKPVLSQGGVKGIRDIMRLIGQQAEKV